MSYAYYKFDKQMYCDWHTHSNIFYNIFLHFHMPILHYATIISLIHRRLSDNPTQKNLLKFCFMFQSKTIITLTYLMCAVEAYMSMYLECIL